jgi:hypothetical protein
MLNGFETWSEGGLRPKIQLMNKAEYSPGEIPGNISK